MRAIERFSLLRSGDRVLTALSGGADSVCLLHFLHENAEKYGITVCAAHYDHRLRGEESERDAEFSRSLCEKLGIEYILGSGDVAAYAAENRLGTEEAARLLRYAFLNEAAEKLGCNKIATAHNADDNAETLLINLCRGSGAKGLSGIPPVRGNIIRPLLLTTRAEILQYLAENDLPHVEDSSNQSDDYTRNLLRHRVMPVLRDINPSFAAAAARTAQSLREDETYFEKEAAEFIAKHADGSSLPIPALKTLARPVAVRVFRQMSPESLSGTHLDALFALLDGEGLAYADLPGLRVSRDSGRLVFGAQTVTLGEYELPINGEIFLSERGMRIKTQIIENCGEVFKSIYKFDFNLAGICGKMTISPRHDGDKIRLRFRGCTKSLKELFSEKKLPQSIRDTTPVFRDENGVIAVFGFGVCERCEARPGDTVLRINITVEDENERGY